MNGTCMRWIQNHDISETFGDIKLFVYIHNVKLTHLHAYDRIYEEQHAYEQYNIRQGLEMKKSFILLSKMFIMDSHNVHA